MLMLMLMLMSCHVMSCHAHVMLMSCHVMYD